MLGCAQVTVGRSLERARLQELVKGKTSKEEVLKILGEPVERDLEGSVERWVYVNRVTSASPKPEWFRLSYAGSVREKKLLIVFDRGIVKDFSYTEGTRPFGSSLGFN